MSAPHTWVGTSSPPRKRSPHRPWSHEVPSRSPWGGDEVLDQKGWARSPADWRSRPHPCRRPQFRWRTGRPPQRGGGRSRGWPYRDAELATCSSSRSATPSSRRRPRHPRPHVQRAAEGRDGRDDLSPAGLDWLADECLAFECTRVNERWAALRRAHLPTSWLEGAHRVCHRQSPRETIGVYEKVRSIVDEATVWPRSRAPGCLSPEATDVLVTGAAGRGVSVIQALRALDTHVARTRPPTRWESGWPTLAACCREPKTPTTQRTLHTRRRAWVTSLIPTWQRTSACTTAQVCSVPQASPTGCRRPAWCRAPTSALPPGATAAGTAVPETALGTTRASPAWVIKPRHGRGRAISTSPMTRTRSPSWSRSSRPAGAAPVSGSELPSTPGRRAGKAGGGGARWPRDQGGISTLGETFVDDAVTQGVGASSAPRHTGRPTSGIRRRRAGGRWAPGGLHRGQSAILGGLPLSIAAGATWSASICEHARPRLEAERLGFLPACGCTATSPRSSRPCLTRDVQCAPPRRSRISSRSGSWSGLVRYRRSLVDRRSSRPGVASAERITTGSPR